MRNPAIDPAFPAFSAVAVVLASTVFGLLLPPSAAAQVYRCEAADGRITYTNERVPQRRSPHANRGRLGSGSSAERPAGGEHSRSHRGGGGQDRR